MNPFLLIPLSLSPFLLRDYFLLQAGPARLHSLKLRLYAAAVLMAVLLIAAATYRLSDQQFLDLLRAPQVALPVVGFYLLLLGVSLWIRRTDRHYWAWLVALAPNPILAFCFGLLGRLMVHPLAVYAAIALSGVLACVWIGLIGFFLRGTEQCPMDVRDLDFSIRVAAWANVIALFIYQPGL